MGSKYGSEISRSCKNYGKCEGVRYFNACERCYDGLFKTGCAYFKTEGKTYLEQLREDSITYKF